MNKDIDHIGMLNLLQAAYDAGKITREEMKKIAARLAQKNEVTIIINP